MDVLTFAEKMELDGKAYYEQLASKTAHAGIRTIFLALAGDEQKHYEVVRSMRDGLAGTMLDSTALEQAKNVFTELSTDQSVVKGLKEDFDGYYHAMKVEADSVRLYEDLATKEEDPERAKLLLKIANEEKRHFNIMENLYDYVLKPGYYLEWREFSNLGQL